MTIFGIVSALVVGAIVGGLGRLVLPGRQRIGAIATVFIGIGAAVIGSFAAAVLGVANTPGIDWIELGIQVALAAVAVSLISGAPDRTHTRR